MPDIKLRDGSGVENTYEGVDTITVPLADGSGTWTFGLTDEDLTFKYDYENSAITLSSMCTLAYRFRRFLNRFDLSQLYSIVRMFSFFKKQDTEYAENFIIQTSEQYPKYIVGLFDKSKITKLPKLDQNGIIVPEFNNMFYNNYSYIKENYIHSNEIVSFLKGIKKFVKKYYYVPDNAPYGGNNSKGSFGFDNMFYGNENITDVLEGMEHIQSVINEMSDDLETSLIANQNFHSMYNSCFFIFSMFFPIAPYTKHAVNTTYNVFNSNFDMSSHYLTKKIVFGTDENNQPIKVHWKNMNINIGNSSYGIGWSTASPTHIVNNELAKAMDVDEPYTLSEQVMYNEITNTPVTTIEEAMVEYNKVKNSNRPYACDSSVRVTYDGAQRYLALLFSNYNHDSAVETINTLPDTSEYLASSGGGTNNIVFKKYSGACTDAGGTNDLTDAEIQVATDKGWTVTFVD